jgi:DDE superfamily endonuclease
MSSGGPETPGTAHPLQARRRGGSAADCPAAGEAAVRLRTLDLTPAGRYNGALGNRRCDQSRDGPQGAKKNGLTKRKIEYWVIPPEQDAECGACMEEVLETYAAAYDPRQPVLCMDEQPVQLLQETRVPIAATKQHGRRVDDAYERQGTASMFMFAEPRSGCRQATARVRRTKADWAIEVAQRLDTRSADCEDVTLVCDNLNTPTKGAFYEAFAPVRARAYIKRLHFCYTPKHGSWLNVAECDLSCFTSQCLSDRRIGELTELQIAIAAWSHKTKAKQRGVDWQFRIENARVKLKRLYPKIKA